MKPELPPADPKLITPDDPWGQGWVPVVILAIFFGVVLIILTLGY